MSTAQQRRPSLIWHLMAWMLGALVVVWASFVALGYQTGVHEADELTDGHLAGVAAHQAVEEVEVDYEGEGFEIGFNARYLLDVAGQIQENTAEFRFADPASPTLVLDPADAGVRYVLMPLRV